MHPAIKYAEQIAYSSKEVLKFTYDMAVKYRDSPGVYVECGVAAGAQIIAMAAGAPDKTIYAFDSFQGIPLPSNKDNQMPGIAMLSKAEQMALPDPGKQELKSSGATSVSLFDFEQNIAFSQVYKEYSNVIPISGWFEEVLPVMSFHTQTFRQMNIEGISILRLDCDLYNSTYVCLKYLYPKVIKGGLVIIDDWALPGCQQAVVDYFYEDNPLAMIGIRLQFIEDKNSTVAYWTK